MRAAEALSTEDCPVKMKLVAPPLYVLTTSTLDKTKGIEVLTAACKACGDSIATAKGRFVVKEAARAVSGAALFVRVYPTLNAALFVVMFSEG